MHNINKFSLKTVSIFAFIAILIILTIDSSAKDPLTETPVFNKFLHYKFDNENTSLFISKKNYFSVLKKQKFFKDSVPAKQLLTSDSIPLKKADSLSIKDSAMIKDTLITKDTIPYKLAKNALEAPLEYTAEDSMVIEVPKKKVTLYYNYLPIWSSYE